jgi:hypothetical protein
MAISSMGWSAGCPRLGEAEDGHLLAVTFLIHENGRGLTEAPPKDNDELMQAMFADFSK